MNKCSNKRQIGPVIPDKSDNILPIIKVTQSGKDCSYAM